MHFGASIRDNTFTSPNSRFKKSCIFYNNLLKKALIKAIIQTSDDSFDNDVINSDIPVLVDFWAEWCGPCKMIGPILEELEIEMAEKIKIVKVDVDSNNQTAMKYAIRSIPTLIIIKDGSVHAQHIGAASKAQLENFINQNI